ncbi:MFS transporter [Novosphingobium malaysiense]|uniref:MFS transporter n=1 Tax=Novosphingobium malaysiense TaxID=1348853 RepID=UPI000AD1F50C|nr:MFS transporter [Novosphingobium malaysiense]
MGFDVTSGQEEKQGRMRQPPEGDERRGGALVPLSEPVFRRIWSASLLSNFGQLIFGVGAAWEMTRLSDSSSLVASVQTAMMIPIMIVTLPAGALSDMFDRRKLAMIGLVVSSVSAAILSLVSYTGVTTPAALLAACVMIGIGTAIFSPAWQSSISEQVSRENLPAAISLTSISYNIARSFGPAIGGAIIVAWGAKAVFVFTSLFYVPLFLAFLTWKRETTLSRLPPERIDRAIYSGLRYSIHSPGVRAVLLRAFAFGFATNAVIQAMLPLVVKDILGGSAFVLGVLLGAQGIGAIGGAMFVSRISERYENEKAIRALVVLAGLVIIGVGLSPWLVLTTVLIFMFGIFYILIAALMNVTIQMSAPRWVVARLLSLFSSAMTGGIAIGALTWGALADRLGVGPAFAIAGICSIASMAIGFRFRLPNIGEESNDEIEPRGAMNVGMSITRRSGPVVIEVTYKVDPDLAREFYKAMNKLRRARLRIGAFNWSLSRNIAEPRVWLERYQCPTWGDYLRMRDRYSLADMQLQDDVNAICIDGQSHASRWLERPYGSVRASEEIVDNDINVIESGRPLGT